MAREFTACFVGLGSIGTRHLRNLKAISEERGLTIFCDALRHGSASLAPDIAALIRTEYHSVDELGEYDFIFICNPSQNHLETLKNLRHKARCFFVEKPVFVQPYDGHEFDDPARFYVACPLRHTRVFAWMKDFVATHRVFSVRAICSSYLPEWRPNQDYRKLYSAARESGGVKVDLIHEFDYLFTLFGLPKRSHLFEGKFSDLEIESNDVTSFVGEYPERILELHLDYLGRVPQRVVEFYTADDVVRCDFIRSEIRFLKNDERIDLAEDRNTYCRREIAEFLDFSDGQLKNKNPIQFANKILTILYKG